MENKPKWKKRLKRLILPLTAFATTFVLSVFCSNLIVNLLGILKKSYVTDGTLLHPAPLEFSWHIIFDFDRVLYSLPLLLFIIMVNTILASFFTYKVHSNYGQVQKGDEKGTGRFTTIEEIKNQYRAIPEKRQRFEGGGGIPVSRLDKKIFIDDTPVNNLIIGTTRSGKGEVFVVPTIDIYSRAKNQASMLITDPKGELFAASKEELEALNYNVKCLNLMNPYQSISYNLLQIVKEEFIKDNFALAQQYARSVAFMIYNDPTAKDKYWQNASTDLVTALILGLCEYCRETPEKISMYNIALMMIDLATQTEEDERSGEMITALDKFFYQFEASHPARMQYATINFAKGQTKAAVMSNTTSQLGVFTLDPTAKMTSDNSLDMRKFGFGNWITGKVAPLKRVKVSFDNGKEETIRSGADGLFTIYHKHELKVGGEVAIIVENSKTIGDLENPKASFVINSINAEGEIEFEQTSGNVEDIKIEEWMYDTRPVALFMIIPDYDQTFNIIASLYIKQVYTLLARIASNVEGNKCHREVIFLIDEFGNMPAIEGMANMLTVCLGRNIRFNLIIQAYSQIEKLYGDDWKTIDGNCNNTIYLLTSDFDTAKRISDTLGPKTITTKSRSGKTLDFDKSKTIGIEARSLLDPNELMRLKEGETVVIRTIKRQDKERKRIQQFPIFNTDKTTLKYRWEYLGDIYDTSRSINDFDIECTHAELNLDDIKVTFDEAVNAEVYKTMKEESTSISTAVRPEIKETEIKINNGLNAVLFRTAFKDEAVFEQIFTKDFSEYEFSEIKDLLIAYQDDVYERNFVMLVEMLNKRMGVLMNA